MHKTKTQHLEQQFQESERFSICIPAGKGDLSADYQHVSGLPVHSQQGTAGDTPHNKVSILYVTQRNVTKSLRDGPHAKDRPLKLLFHTWGQRS